MEDIQSILKSYKMLPSSPLTTGTPIAKTSELEEQKKLEAYIMDQNTMLDVSVLLDAIQVSRCVCYIQVGGENDSSRYSATGFLIGHNLVITNSFNIYDTTKLDNCRFRFNYQLGFNGMPENYSEYVVKEGGIFLINKELDYTIIELDGYPITIWGYAVSDKKSPIINDRVSVIGHLGGGPKRISVQAGFIQYINNVTVQYIAPTSPGSSGSLIFNKNWRVIAMHRSSGRITEPQTGKSYFRKEGPRISAIINDLQKITTSDLGIISA